MPQQSGQDLDGFSESHVIGEASAHTELRAQPQPVQPGELIAAECRLQRGGRPTTEAVWRAQGVEFFAKRIIGLDAVPTAVFIVAFIQLAEIGRCAS